MKVLIDDIAELLRRNTPMSFTTAAVADRCGVETAEARHELRVLETQGHVGRGGGRSRGDQHYWWWLT